MNRKSAVNIVLFVLLSVVVLGGWWLVETYFFPKPPPPETKPQEKKNPTELPATTAQVRAAEPLLAVSGAGVVGKPAEVSRWAAKVKAAAPPKPVESSDPQKLIALSGDGYNLQVLLNNKGGGVQQVVVPAFEQASRGGKRAKDAAGQEYPLELVPGYYRDVKHTTVLEDGPHHKLEAGVVGALPEGVALAPASYTLLHYDAAGGAVARPSNELAARKWAVVKMKDGKPADDGVEVVVRADENGAEKEREVVFETTLGEPHFVRIRKTFTLAQGDYHVRMRLDFAPADGRPAVNPPKLRYQISGPRNVPIEGEWYSGTLRNAVVGYKGKGGEARRAIQDSTRITTEHGSAAYAPKSNEAPGDLTFAAVVNQFFAAAVCIDPDQPNKDVWEYVRATREWQDNPFERGLDEHYADKPQLGDITVRAVSRDLPLLPGQSESHAYWLFHGPTKVRLLNTLHLFGDDHKQYEPDPALVSEKYSKAIGLTAITDSASPNWFGGFLQAVMWTDLVVWFTNIMHDILGWMHEVVPVWIVNILMLTVLVRLVLLLPSRRQQAGMLKMQEKMAAMKPELDKLQEKYKNDPQRLNQEKTRLMIQHGVNPLTSMGGCLLMFAQMPIFLGLYYCLQESIFFRLHGTGMEGWVPNLAAPDMLVWWSESIPFLSSADQVGHSWYLGPFFNLLPVVAVALMYLNFKISSPPPTDEQQAMQQKTMKFMMIFMGVFFYKMAAGLCLYFICSTLWGMTERWLLKRKRKKMEEAAAAGVVDGPSLNGTPAKPTAPPKPPGFLERVKSGLLEKLEEAQKQGEAQRQIVNNPQQKPPAPPKPPPGQGGQGKRKRRKK
jgi:YidC/Oxa1 family membrane protein insertase